MFRLSLSLGFAIIVGGNVVVTLYTQFHSILSTFPH